MRRSNARSLSFAWVALAAAMATSCGGQQQLGSDMSFQPDSDPNEHAGRVDDEAGGQTDEARRALPLVSTEPAAQLPLLGVRPDLALSASAPKTARCACLSVEIGAPSDAKFQWQAGAPTTGPGALAIAVSSRGVECPGGEADDTKRRPSISAVDVDGNDVVVEIEELPDGPPLASGALIPEPGPGGSVYVRGRNKKVVYARSKESSRCKVR